ncbi:MAG TPA: RNA-binding domain-containing protein [Thermoanaerobaculia bacterium]|nr:RNA-binding domain-containing protein [Thermoanaerobaculia bacterium]
MDRQRILVVDDDDRWLRTIELILGGKYDLEFALEPAAAVSLVKSSFFSLAILDQRLSGDASAGADLLRRLHNVRQDLRAIILTGYAEVEDAVESMKIGAFDYISKGRPDLASELLSRVEKALADDPHEERLAALIKRGESARLEFKASARWDMRLKKLNHDLEGSIIKTVAAFLNSTQGGVLLIGVDDGGKTVGLHQDFKTLRRQDRDGFERFLVTLLLNAFGKDVSPHLRIDFDDVAGNDVCRISVKPCHRPVYVSDGTGADHFFIRAGNSTRQLSTREAVEYCKLRWK